MSDLTVQTHCIMQLAICFVFIALRRTRGYNQKKQNNHNQSQLPTTAAILTWLRVQFAPAAKAGGTENKISLTARRFNDRESIVEHCT